MKCSLCSQLVVSILRDVPHPGQSLVAGLLDDLEVSDLQQQLTSNIEITEVLLSPEYPRW